MRMNVGSEKAQQGINRRSFLKTAGVAGAAVAAQAVSFGELFGQEPTIELEDASYLALYNGLPNCLMKDPEWIKYSASRLRWPRAGEPVPELSVMVDLPSWTDIMRKIGEDGKRLGLKYNILVVSNARRNTHSDNHTHGDIEVHAAVQRPERVDPADYLGTRAYGLDRRNYGEWANKEYDDEVRRQSRESDGKERLKHVQDAQRILAEDLYIAQVGWGPAIIEAYNSAEWDGVVQVRGFGVSSSDLFWTYLNIAPKTSKKRLTVGVVELIKTTNIIADPSRFRAIGRMIYDRLAFMDKDLKVIPWAAESWEKLDNRTWDLKLRGGMKFHDGKPVTVEDLKFTFDFMLRYERSAFWAANRFLESVEIKDAANRIVRFRFKEPFGQFETYFLQLNVIFPKHLWDGIMEQQKVGENPLQLKIPNPIGSGPFKFVHHKADAECLLAANKEHFQAPKIDELLYVVVPSVDGICGRLENQEIDMAEIAEGTYLTVSQGEQLKKSKHITVVRTPDINWFHLVPRISTLPWRDIEFRRAWHHSLDRDFLVKSVWEGGGRVPSANTFFVDGNPWHNPKLPPIPKYDLALARKILTDAGYSWDSQGRLVYPPPTDKKFVERVTRVSNEGFHWGGLKMLATK
jgi:peptide/nickel transport system substrate-binding protein